MLSQNVLTFPTKTLPITVFKSLKYMTNVTYLMKTCFIVMNPIDVQCFMPLSLTVQKKVKKHEDEKSINNRNISTYRTNVVQ